MKKLSTILFLLICAVSIANSQDLSGKISGQVFFDYFYNVSRDAGYSSLENKAISGDKDMNGFQFRRIFFTYDKEISDKLSFRFRLEANQKALASDKSISVFVKDAYLKYSNIFEGSDIYLGIQPTIGYEISEASWGYRGLEKTQMDLRGYLPSRDMGITLRGKIDGEGMFNYAVQYGNSSDVYVDGDRYKRISANVHIKPFQNFNLTLYGEKNFKVNEQDGINVSLFTGYNEKDKLSFGVEGFFASQSKSYTKPNDTVPSAQNALGISVFAYYFFLPELGAIARYDYFDPNTDETSKGDSRNYFIAGITWKAAKNLQIIPNIQYEMYEKVSSPTAADVTYDPSLNARITLIYSY
jgi:hypothetical protein